MQATRCPRCGLLADPGDYGLMPWACLGWHFPHEIDGFALPADGPSDTWNSMEPCDGSECTGVLVDLDDQAPARSEPCPS
jgi:hypothetical protein